MDPRDAPGPITLFLAGDVMTGRGVDQILPHPGDPRIPEPYVRDAGAYVRLAETAHGPVPRNVDPGYPWGQALPLLDRVRPCARIVNLETAVTVRGAPWPGKEVHYRMHPANVACLSAAKLDVCVLANNHALDYGREGLSDTLMALHGAGLRTVGAGETAAEAHAPATVPLPGGAQLHIVAYGCPSSGVPADWAAGARRPGVALLAELSARAAEEVLARVHAAKGSRDLAIVSLHWGGNWGYEVPVAHRDFAHRLVEGGVDLVYGHSSHHLRPMEVHEGRLILYGCGDFIDDYEGIQGYEAYRDDLRVMFFPTLDPATGALMGLRLVPLLARRLSLQLPDSNDAAWLARVLNAECASYGVKVVQEGLALEVSPSRRGGSA